MTNSDDVIRSKLDNSRKDLLQLGLRNRLLNYRPLRTRGVEIIDELPSELFRILVQEGKTMSFLPVKDEEHPGLFGQPEEEEISGQLAARHTDTRLQTGLSSSQLQSRLLSTYYLANRGYVNRCVNDIRRRPSQPLIQWRFHTHTVHRDRRLRSTQGPSDA